jgi:hypothetical protein
VALDGETVAVSVTGCPKTDGFAELERAVLLGVEPRGAERIFSATEETADGCADNAAVHNKITAVTRVQLIALVKKYIRTR